MLSETETIMNDHDPHFKIPLVVATHIDAQLMFAVFHKDDKDASDSSKAVGYTVVRVKDLLQV